MTKNERYMENAATTAILIEAGVDMMRQNIRRLHPDADDDTVNSLLAAWMRREDDPLPGDTGGAVRVRERCA